MIDDGVIRRLTDLDTFLMDNLGALTRACKTAEERQELDRQLQEASTNLTRARNAILRRNTQVQDLITQLGNAETQIRTSIQEFKNIQEALNAITDIVRVGKQIIALGAGAPS